MISTLKHTSFKTMKNSLIWAVALGAVACSQENTSDLAQLQGERDSLVALTQSAATRIQEIDAQLAALDSTRELTVVTVLEVRPETFVHSFEALGKVEADRSVNLLPEMGGQIKRVLVSEGDRVAAGQTLIELDNSVLRSTLDEVKKSLALAATLYEKQERLWKQGIGSEVQYLQAKTNKESLEQRIQTVQSQLAMSRVKAPFAGTVDEMTAKEGEFAAPGMALGRLISSGKASVTADIPESYANVVGKGQKVDLQFPSINKTMEARVTQVSDYINPDNRTYKVFVDLPSSSEFKPNMLAKVQVRDYEADQALSVPSALVQQDMEGNNYVFVWKLVKDGIGLVEKRAVEVGKNNGTRVEIKSGLALGETLVDKGARTVRNGQSVKVMTESAK
jgi:RND family efflux transporter MFP subunit